MQKQREEENKKVRFNVLTMFLRLTIMGPSSGQSYMPLLAPNFVLTSPVTPFRSFSRHQVVDGLRFVKGLSEIVEEGCSIRVMIAEIGKHNTKWKLTRLQKFCRAFPGLFEGLQVRFRVSGERAKYEVRASTVLTH